MQIDASQISEATELSIQQAAEATGLSIDTLRYYERMGLFPRVQRAASGHRRFGPRELGLIQFVTKLRATGMKLTQIRAYVALAMAGDATIEQRHEMLAAHERAVVAHIAELEAALAIIRFKLQHYCELKPLAPAQANGTATPRPRPAPLRAVRNGRAAGG